MNDKSHVYVGNTFCFLLQADIGDLYLLALPNKVNDGEHYYLQRSCCDGNDSVRDNLKFIISSGVVTF